MTAAHTIHTSCLPVLKSWWLKSVTENRRPACPPLVSTPATEMAVTISEMYIFSKQWDQIFQSVASQDICNDTETNLQPATRQASKPKILKR